MNAILKILTLSIFLFFGVIHGLSAQCTISLNTQDEVDNFSPIDPNNPLCSGEYVWTLWIQGPDITNLDALSILDSCGRLVISNTSLVDLSGLENLTFVYRDNSTLGGDPGVEIDNNPLLQTLNGLQNLKTTSNITISNNPVLENTDALNITEFLSYPSSFDGHPNGKNIEIINNAMLQSFTGLPGLVSASDIIIRDNLLLTDISALSNLRSCYYRKGIGNIFGSMYIENNDALPSLSILDSLYIVDIFSVVDNDKLQNLSGLSLTVKNFTIVNNNSLSEFGDFNLTSEEDWLFEASINIFENDSLVSIALSDFEIGINTNPEDISVNITDNTMLSMCSEDYICSFIQDGIAQFNVSNNAVGCNSPAELCFAPTDDLDFEVTFEKEFTDCSLLNYTILVTNLTPNVGSTRLKFYISDDEDMPLYEFTHTDNAEVVDDTLIWNMVDLAFFEVDTFNVSFEVSEDYSQVSDLEISAVISDDDDLSNNEMSSPIGYRTVLNLDLITQASVDSCKCISEVLNNLEIQQSDDITNLDGLDNLVTVGRTLLIEDNESLQFLSGLNKLEICNDLHIINNNNLKSITGLNTLVEIDDELDILNNNLLDSIVGFDVLMNLRDLTITNNPKLKNIVGLDGFDRLTYLRVIDNPSLPSLEAFQGLRSVWSDVIIENNQGLTSLYGLHNLERITSGELVVKNCNRLKDLSGLTVLTDVDDINISFNDSLVSLNGFNPIEISDLVITNNPVLLSLDGFTPAEINRDFILENNAKFESFGNFNPIDILTAGTGDNYSIRNNPQLDLCNIDFICNRIESGQDISIWNNGTDCSNLNEVSQSCEGDCTINLTTQEEVDNFSDNGCLDILIYGIDIVDLKGLESLTSCRNLTIDYTSVLDLDGLENLNEVSNLTLNNNPNLENLNALNITEVNFYEDPQGFTAGGKFNVTYNSSLTNLNGFSSLTHLGSLIISHNPSLVDISGLSNLTKVDLQISENTSQGDLIIDDNDALTSVSVFDSIEVTRRMRISRNDNLVSISDITIEVSELSIEDNESLIDLQDVNLTLRENSNACRSLQIVNNSLLTSIDLQKYEDEQSGDWNCFEIEISGNSSLTVCNEDYICELIDVVENDGQVFNISNNSEGCNDLAEVTAACTTSTSDLLADDIFDIYPNPVNDLLTIDYKGSNNTRVDISLSKIDGQEIISVQQDNANSQILDVSNIPNGLYLLSLKTNEGVLVKKIVVE